MKTLQIKIDCGETTCASEPGKFCEYIGSRHFGTAPICTLFPSDIQVYSFIEEKEGWMQRCPACLEAEVK